MVIDPSALVAILLQEDDARVYVDAIAGASEARLSAASYVELSLVGLSRGARGRQEVDETLRDAAIEVVAFDVDQARIAADAFARFGKGRHPAALNLGDCFSYALARTCRQPLLFKGRDFTLTDVASALGGRTASD